MNTEKMVWRKFSKAENHFYFIFFILVSLGSYEYLAKTSSRNNFHYRVIRQNLSSLPIVIKELTVACKICINTIKTVKREPYLIMLTCLDTVYQGWENFIQRITVQHFSWQKMQRCIISRENWIKFFFAFSCCLQGSKQWDWTTSSRWCAWPRTLAAPRFSCVEVTVQWSKPGTRAAARSNSLPSFQQICHFYGVLPIIYCWSKALMLQAHVFCCTRFSCTLVRTRFFSTLWDTATWIGYITNSTEQTWIWYGSQK